MSSDDSRPVYAAFFGVMGASASIIFSCEFILPTLAYIIGSHSKYSNQAMIHLHWLASIFCPNYHFGLCPPLFFLSLSLSSSGSSLWYSQEWHRYCSHERHETRPHHQVCHPCGYGWYHCHLRPGGVCADSKQV